MSPQTDDARAGAGRVAVTGGAGMLGSALVRRLAADGRAVTSIDVQDRPDPPAGAEHVVADVRDAAALARLLPGAAAVVHCAGALPSYPVEQINSLIVGGTGSVLAAAREAGVPRVVHVSSTAVYGLPDVVPTPESHPLLPIDVYGAAKVAAEQVCLRYRDEGMCVPILRPKTFVGAGRMGLFAMLFEWAEEGHNFPVLGRGDALIQMFAIEDLVDAVLTVLAAPADVACDTYNLAAARFGALRDDFQAVLDAAGHGKRVVSVPAGPALAVLKLLERAHLSPVYGRLQHKLLADSYVSIDHARERLGWAPRYSNREALLNAYAWWRANRTASTGRTSRDAWRQGALRTAKVLF